MAATSSANTNRGIGGNPGLKPYPFTEKVPVPVKIMMPGYEIKGNMYKVSHQKIEHVLLEKMKFIHLTDAEVCALASGKRMDIPFLAVNKGLILSLYEQNAADV